MTSSQPDTSGSLRAARQIDEVCDRFEVEWKRGEKPLIENFLTEFTGTARRRLLEELLLLDVHWRKTAGQSPRGEDYAARFSELTVDELGELVRRGLGEAKRPGSTPGDDSTVAAQASGDRSRAPPPRLRYFGDYELLDQIARGGMGVVYKARQISLNRLVAVKMILSGQFASEAQVKRFYSEAESAAQLDHPNIVSIYEVGEHEGDHYFSMALVEGTSLAAKLTEGPMEPRRAAELVSQVAQAIEYAHSKGVIHRDLKPSNVLLDANDRPRVTDFGLAKRVSDADGLTMTGDVLGTPSYMPPEQAAGKIDAVGPASDVYALGAVLYALLAGRPPFQAASSVDTLRQVVDQEPVRLRQLNSAVPRDLETIAQKCLEKSVSRRYSTAAALAQDLDNYLAGRPILARPTSLGERTWRWCRRNPLVASLTAAVVIALLGGTAVSSYFAVSADRRAVSEGLAKEAAIKAQNQSVKDLAKAQESERNEIAAKLLETEAKNGEIAQRQIAEKKTRIAEAERLAAQSQSVLNEFPTRSLLLAIEAIETTRSTGEPVLPSAEQALRAGLAVTGGTMIDHKSIDRLKVSPDGKWLAGRHGTDGVFLYDITTVGERLAPQYLPTPSGGDDIYFTADSHCLIGGIRYFEKFYIWDLKAPSPAKSVRVVSLKIVGAIRAPTVSHNGRWFAAFNSGTKPETKVWDLSAADPSEPIAVLEGLEKDVDILSFSPNERWLAATTAKGYGEVRDSTIQLWDMSSGTPRAHTKLMELNPKIRRISNVAFSRSGRWFAAGSAVKTWLWDLNSADPVRSTQDGEFGERLLFTPDERWLISGATACDLGTSEPLQNVYRLPIPNSSEPVAASDDGRVFAKDRASLFEIKMTSGGPEPTVVTFQGHDGNVRAAALSANRNLLFTSGNDSLRAWPLSHEANLADPLVLPGMLVATAIFSPDNHWLVISDGPTLMCPCAVFDLQSANPGERVSYLSRRMPAVQNDYPISDIPDRSFAFTRDSQTLITGDADHLIRLWDFSGKPKNDVPPKTLAGHRGAVGCVAVSPDGRWLASGSADKSVRLWDLTTANPAATSRELTGHTRPITEITFSPDSRRLATGCNGGNVYIQPFTEPELDDTCRLWDVHSTDPQATVVVLNGHAGGSSCLAFSPDNRWLYTCSSGYMQGINRANGKSRLWDLSASNPVEKKLKYPEGSTLLGTIIENLRQAEFSRDGRWLVAANWSGSTLYDLRAVEQGGAPRLLPSTILTTSIGKRTSNSYSGPATFSRNSSHLYTGNGSTVLKWDLTAGDPTLEPIQLAGHESRVTFATVSPDGRWLFTAGDNNVSCLWRLQIDDLIATAQQVAARELIDNERKIYRVERGPPTAAKPAVRVVPSSKPAAPRQVDSVSWTPQKSNGLELIDHEDGRFDINGKGRDAVATAKNTFLYFGVVDTFAHDLSPDPADSYWVEVQLRAGQQGRMNVQFDAQIVGDNDDGRWTATSVEPLLGKSYWQTFRFDLPRAKFANRQNSSADFRLSLLDGATADVRKVTLSRIRSRETPADKSTDAGPAVQGLKDKD